MGGFNAASFTLSDRVEYILKKYSTSYSLPSFIVTRARIVLMAAQGKKNNEITDELHMVHSTVSKWRNRFYDSIELIAYTEAYQGVDQDEKLEEIVYTVLSDAPRPGAPSVFTQEQAMLVNELACKNPKDFGHEQNQWTLEAIAREAVSQNIMEAVSPSTIQRFLKLGGVEPWKNRYWLNSPEKHEDPETFKKN